MAILDFKESLDKLKTTMSQFFSTSGDKLSTLKDRLNDHTETKGNVHGMEPEDIGLGNVPNWLPSTLKQAQGGLSNNSFMTPRRVDDYADKNIYTVIGDAFKDAADDL